MVDGLPRMPSGSLGARSFRGGPAWLLLLLIPAAAAGLLTIVLGPDGWTAEAVFARRDELKAAVSAAPLLSLGLFAALYFAIISSALPVGPPMSLLAGFLFGRWVGTSVILLAATAGAVVVFSLAGLSVRTAAGERLRARAGPAAEAAIADLRRNAFGYLLVMRLVPFFPFFLVNALAGIAGIRARTFVLATLIGRLPAAFLYVSLGEEVGRATSLGELASGRVAALLTALALFALGPVLLARRRHAGIGAGARRR